MFCFLFKGKHFLCSVIIFVFLVFPKKTNANWKIKTENRKWTVETIFAFCFPFLKNEIENGKQKAEDVFRFFFILFFTKRKSQKWKKKMETEKGKTFSVLHFFVSGNGKINKRNENGQRKTFSFSVFSFLFVLCCGRQKWKTEKGNPKRFPLPIFVFLFSIYPETKTTEHFAFTVFPEPSLFPFSFSVFSFSGNRKRFPCSFCIFGFRGNGNNENEQWKTFSIFVLIFNSRKTKTDKENGKAKMFSSYDRCGISSLFRPAGCPSVMSKFLLIEFLCPFVVRGMTGSV